MQKKAQKIIQIIQNHEIQIIDFLIFNEKSLTNHDEEEFERISLNSKFIDEDLLINGFESQEFKKILPNLDLYFFNLFSSKISLQIICTNHKLIENDNNILNLYIAQNPIINFSIKNKDLHPYSFNLVYDFCTEVFEYFENIDSSQSYSLKSFYIESDKNIKFEINYSENLSKNQNLVDFFYKSLILKNILRNTARNFNFKTEFSSSFCKFQITSANNLIKIPYPFSLSDLLGSINFIK